MECDIRIHGKETCRETDRGIGEGGEGRDCCVRGGRRKGEKRREETLDEWAER